MSQNHLERKNKHPRIFGRKITKLLLLGVIRKPCSELLSRYMIFPIKISLDFKKERGGYHLFTHAVQL